MKTWQKVLLGFFVGGVLVVIGGVVTLKILFPPERIKEMAIAQLVEALGREIKLAEASIGLGGIELGDLQISEEPNFAAGTAASIKSLSVSVDWHPLIVDKEVHVTDLSIDGLALNVIVKKEKPSKKNKTGPSKKESKEKTDEIPDFLLAKVSVTNGKIDYRDENTGTKASVSNLDLTTTEATLSKPFPLSLTADFSYDKTLGSIDFKGKVDPKKGEFEKMGSVIESLALVWDGKKYKLSGELKPFSAPSGDLAVSLPAMEAGGVNIPALNGTVHTGYKNELLSLKNLNLKGDNASLKGSVLQTKAGWKLSKLAAKLDGLSVTLDGTYTETALDLRVRSTKMDLKAARKWALPLKEMNALGTASIDLKAEGKPDAPNLSGNVTLANASLTASEQTLSKLNGDLAFTPKKLDAALKGALNGSAFDIKLGAIGYNSLHPKITLNGTLAKLDLTKLPKSKSTQTAPAEGNETSKKKEPVSKTLTDAKGSISIGSIEHPRFKAGKTSMRWDLQGIGHNLSKLNGTVTYNVGAGKFDDLKQLGESNSMVKIVLLPIMIIQKVAGLVKIPLFPNFDKVDFSEIVGDYSIRKGLMTVKKSHLKASISNVTMTGKADLGKDKLDLRVNAQIARVKTPVAFKVLGSMADPSVKLDTAAILKQPEVNKALKKGEEILRKQGEQLLKGLFGR